MAPGRQVKADAAIVAAATELAPLVSELIKRFAAAASFVPLISELIERLTTATELTPIVSELIKKITGSMRTSDCEIYGAAEAKIVKMLSLATTIEGLAGLPSQSNFSSSDLVERKILLEDLVTNGIYITHFDGRDEEWTLLSVNHDTRQIIIKLSASTKGTLDVIISVNAADYGLCPYGVGEEWNSHAWTSSMGIKTTDGADILKLAGAQSQDYELPEDDEEQ
jgi:hypothetical protein